VGIAQTPRTSTYGRATYGAATTFCAMTSGGSSHSSRRRRSPFAPLLELIARGDIDPGFVVSHRWPLSRAPEPYRLFNDKADDGTGCGGSYSRVSTSPAGGRGHTSGASAPFDTHDKRPRPSGPIDASSNPDIVGLSAMQSPRSTKWDRRGSDSLDKS
jgi:hypothetical protein